MGELLLPRLQKPAVLFLSFIYMFVGPHYISAQNDRAGEYGIITGFEVVGLKKTRHSVIEKTLHPFMGLWEFDVSINDIHAAIISTGILQPEKIEIQNNTGGPGKIIYLELSEKWSIFPMPVFFADTDRNISGGLFVANMNAFGINDRFAIGGIFGSKNIMAMFFYNHNARTVSLPDWAVNAFYGYGENKITDQKNNNLVSWNAHAARSSVTVSHTLRWNSLKPSLRAGLQYAQLIGWEDGTSPVADSLLRITITPGIGWQKNGFDGILSLTNSFGLSYTAGLGLGSGNVQTINVNGNYERPIFPGFKLSIHSQAAYAWNPDLYALLRPSTIAPILPGSFRAAHFAGASAGLEKSLFQWKFGTVCVLANYQLIGSSGPHLGDSFDHGFGAGLCLYLSRVALPAMSITYNYNVPKRYFAAGFSIGMSF
jgi:hypothetical protein